MSPRRLPDEAAMPPANDGTAQIVASLEAAGRDLSLPADARELFARARDALRATSNEAEAARLRYHALFDAVPDPVSILDERGIVLDLNKAGLAAYRRPREEIVGRPIEVLNPDLPKDHMQPVLETLNRGETYVIEVANMRGDGTRFPVEVHSAGFVHDGRRCVVAVARDLSARRVAELRYGQLLEVMDKGVLVLDDHGRLVQANAAAMRILGADGHVDFQTYLRAADWAMVDEGGRPITVEDLPPSQTLRTGRATESRVLGLYHRPERRLRWLSVSSVPLFAPGGRKPVQVLSFFSDVTQLKRDSALFDRAQSLAHIGGWEWEVDRDALYMTVEALRILGGRPLHRIGDLLTALTRDDRARLRDALDVAISGNRPIDIEVQGTHADGSPLWVRIIGEAEINRSEGTSITGTLQDITERKQEQETLRVRARTDPLTGLLNRDAMLYELDTRMRDPLRGGIAVLYIDLDRFKMVNDVLGHAAGDDLLSTAARRIARAAGTEGLVARFGGDEFLVACNTRDDETRPDRIADAILEAFSESFRFEKEEFAITASIGIARAPRDGDRPQLLIQNADAAMYDSKRRIRNGRQEFTPELAQSQENRLRMETQLRRAADNDEFRLVYQPQVDLRNGATVAAEALIRWQNHQLGEMRPDHFIGHAETTGDIVRIGGWVLRQACRQAAEWRDAGLGIIRVAVNVSYRQFLVEDLARAIREALDEHALPGSALELEFTERVLIEDAPDTLRTFAALREMGVILTIDDFGEGYSALNYLRRLPIHGLKLSQLFVEGVPGNASDVAVCQAVAGIARSLGLGLVAEGIESEAQRRFMLELGVPVGQGFLFAPGLTPDEFARRMTART
ncbi:sensor domain-containing protein [Luteimonas kalidii]|uniref:EAL domain-containing protein n=1 Tax=Luteimonas kalidii TaxID=3042025 RepID=A0ABT6JU37_9GAMM|nr:EAL domain-containing protein [Luteimonas kalidii]MDH5834204.1 EAL domain-containing protein [Luteimonas kalidii]